MKRKRIYLFVKRQVVNKIRNGLYITTWWYVWTRACI